VGDDGTAERVAECRAWRGSAATAAGADGLGELLRLGVVGLGAGDRLLGDVAGSLMIDQEFDQPRFLHDEALEQPTNLLALRLALAGGAQRGRTLLGSLADRWKL